MSKKDKLNTGIIGYEDIMACKKFGKWYVKDKKGKWNEVICPLAIAELEQALRS